MTCERYIKDDHFSMLEKTDSTPKKCFISDLTCQVAAEDCCAIVKLTYRDKNRDILGKLISTGEKYVLFSLF